MSARDVELPAGWLTADTVAAARRIAQWQETDRQWTLRTRLALARALVPECAVVPDKEPLKVALAVLCMARDNQTWHENTLKDFSCAIDGLRAMIAAGEATDDGR